MSIQSMKYHNLPTAKQIEAYNSGRMSTGERKWMDSMIKRNPFVKESVEAAKSTDMAAVGRISSYMSSNVTAQYLTKVGFWSKYGGWISFSSIAIIIGAGVFFGPDLYNKYTVSENLTEIESAVGDDKTKEIISENEVKHDAADALSTGKEMNSSKTLDNIDVQELDGQPSEVNDNQVVVDDNYENLNETSLNEENLEAKTVAKDLAAKETKLTVLSAKKVTISSKFDPDNIVTSNFPVYPGGDLALCDYFKSKLRAIQVPDAEKYSKKATIVLQVSAKGKVTSSSISGHIHPTHESALKSAIDSLPKFETGKSKVQYSLLVSF